MKGFTLVEVLVAMLIFVTAVVFLVGAFISAQRAIIFAKHKQQAIFILQERVEQVKNTDWGTMTSNGGIMLMMMGTVTKKIETIEYETSPGTTTRIIPNSDNVQANIWEIDLLDLSENRKISTATVTEATPYKLMLDILYNGNIPDRISGGTFTFISTWMEEGRKIDVTFPAYLAWYQ
ncbi:MAG: prepilin-type N-terminal cleavage/methylation domain-containing protein [Candidatus Desantisbacteria bacterium]